MDKSGGLEHLLKCHRIKSAETRYVLENEIRKLGSEPHAGRCTSLFDWQPDVSTLKVQNAKKEIKLKAASMMLEGPKDGDKQTWFEKMQAGAGMQKLELEATAIVYGVQLIVVSVEGSTFYNSNEDLPIVTVASCWKDYIHPIKFKSLKQASIKDGNPKPPPQSLERREIDKNCLYCGNLFTRRGDVRMHMKTCEKKKNYDNAVAEGVPYNIHFKTDLESRTCKTCGKIFNTTRGIAMHEKFCQFMLYSGNNCVMCGKYFSKPESAREHVKICLRREEYVASVSRGEEWNVVFENEVNQILTCRYCSKVFRYEGRRIRHEGQCSKSKKFKVRTSSIKVAKCFNCDFETSGHLRFSKMRQHEYECTNFRLKFYKENCRFCGGFYGIAISEHELTCKQKNIALKHVLAGKAWKVKLQSKKSADKCRFCKQPFTNPKSHEFACPKNPNRSRKVHEKPKVMSVSKRLMKMRNKSGLATKKYPPHIKNNVPSGLKLHLSDKFCENQQRCVVCAKAHDRRYSLGIFVRHQNRCLGEIKHDKFIKHVTLRKQGNKWEVPDLQCKLCDFNCTNYEGMRLHVDYEHI